MQAFTAFYLGGPLGGQREYRRDLPPVLNIPQLVRQGPLAGSWSERNLVYRRVARVVDDDFCFQVCGALYDYEEPK